MGLQEDKEIVLSGVYNAKELLFFVIGVGTLIAVPFLGSESRATTYQIVVIGVILTLEGFSSVVEMTFDFMIQRGIPWIENVNRKRKLRKKV